MRSDRNEREFDSYVESPLRSNKTSVEVVIANPGDISGGTSSNISIKAAGSTISALKCVYILNPATVDVAESDVDFSKATVFGIAVTAALLNEQMQIQTYGSMNDSSFNWPANTQLYLSATGSLTDVQPLSGYRTLVAVSHGPGQIFINIQETIIL